MCLKGDGMSGNIKRTEKIRNYIEEVLSPCKHGTVIFTHEIASALCDRLHHGESMRDVGMALRERDDVELMYTGAWMKK